MYSNYSYMKSEILEDAVRFYFNYEQEQAVGRQENSLLEEHPNKEKYTDFDYTIPFTSLPSINILPIVSNSAFESQIDKEITEEWAWENGAMDLGEAVIFKTVQFDTQGQECEVVRMCIGVLNYHCEGKDWKGTCESYE